MSFPSRLLDGYTAFRKIRLTVEQDRFRNLAETGQRPEVMVIGCCDSRVSPEVIFDAHPGELFVVRNVANLVPPFSRTGLVHGVSAALEFGVQALKVKHIVVLGHARCGGIRAYAGQGAPLSPGDFIGKWMSLIQPAADAVGPQGSRPLNDYLAQLERESVAKTLGNLMTFPWIGDLVARQSLQLHGAYFDVATGMLSVRDKETGTFASIARD
ncbi:MAG: carbonic anhydrase [Alphaproteobacteria bacterium]